MLEPRSDDPMELRDSGDFPIGDLPAYAEFDIGDDRIHEILARLGVILHDQIADANQFFMRGGGGDHRLARPMDDIEAAGWESIFGIDEVVEDAVNKGLLFVVNIDDDQEALPAPSAPGGLVRPFTGAITRDLTEPADAGDTVRVNYGDEAHWIPSRLLTRAERTDDLTYVIKPQIHFGGGRSITPGHLYNAFVALDTYVQAPNGTHLVSKIEGTGIPGAPTSKPVYSPYNPIGASLWTNTSLKENAPNSFSVKIDRPGYLMLGCDIHDIAALPQLEVPKADKVRMWFWQLDRFIKDQTLALPPAPAQVIDAN